MIRFHSAFQCPARFTAILFAAALVLATYAEAAVLTPVQAVFDKHLQALYSVAVAPDGAHVYVADAKGGLFVFMRNNDGSLTPIETLRNGEGGVGGLAWAMSVTVSPDGANVYVASIDEVTHAGTVAVFSRDAATGTLTFVEAQYQGVGGVDGLQGTFSVTVSPDGAHVYAASIGETMPDDAAGAVAVFSRDGTTGALTFIEAYFDGQDGVDGLGRASSVTVSPDGANVYVASQGDHAVAVFSRNATTGALTFVEAHFDGAGGARGLKGAVSVMVSPDGAHVYVASVGLAMEGAGIAVFARNETTGALTFVEAQFDGAAGVDGLAVANSVTVSPDGAHLYVTSYSQQGAVAVFSRDAATGALTFVEAQFHGEGREDGLLAANSVTVSPDGAHLYVASGDLRFGDNAVTVFSRDAATGALTFVEALRDGAGGVDGLLYASSVTVSPDGAHLYVASFVNYAVVVFSRDATTGALTLVETHFDGMSSEDAFYFLRSVAMSPDGAHLYVATYGNAITLFSRDATTGALTFVEAPFDGPAGVDGFDFAKWVTVSPDGAHVYVAGTTGFAPETKDDAVAVFSRNAMTGVLTFIEAQFEGVGGVVGIDGAKSVTVSPDGAHVYVASGSPAYPPESRNDAVAAFSRDAATGALTFIEAHFDGVDGVEGLRGVDSVTPSPDGGHLYMLSSMAELAVFSRNATTGVLTFVEAQFEGVAGVSGLYGASSLAVSPDGAHVYVAGYADDSAVVFSRDAATGALTFAEAHFDGQGGAEGLDGASSVAVSPDGAHVYLASREDNAVQVFAVGAQGVGEGEGEGEGSEDSQGEGEGEGGPIGCAATGFQAFETKGVFDDALVPILIGLLLLSAAGRRQRATHGKGGSPQE